jgi:integrase/recombinase XerD
MGSSPFAPLESNGTIAGRSNLIYIRDFLGHCSVVTTEIYARADSEMKRKAIESAYMDLSPLDMPKWEENEDLMYWLQNLCR